jgi:hypothetical protein
MRALLRRLASLEDHRPSSVSSLRLFWADEIGPCEEHRNCSVEQATGLHIADPVRLSFSEVRE